MPARAEAAHQIVNDSEVVLRYLCFSTMVEPDVMVYPDSGKVGIFGGAAPGGPKEKRTFSKFLREEAEVGYYEGQRQLALGLRSRLPFRVFALPGPSDHSRLVIDVAHRW